MVDGFFWTRVTAKELRYLYGDIALAPVPDAMSERARLLDVPRHSDIPEPVTRDSALLVPESEQ
jgi:hypothetical protein